MKFDEAQLANVLRTEILKSSQNEIKVAPKKEDISKFEYISTQKQETQEQPYISPIMTMNEDEILAFVEEFEVNELATLSTVELNRIGEVLGVEPRILLNEKIN